jgi:hypothetical protein
LVGIGEIGGIGDGAAGAPVVNRPSGQSAAQPRIILGRSAPGLRRLIADAATPAIMEDRAPENLPEGCG